MVQCTQVVSNILHCHLVTVQLILGIGKLSLLHMQLHVKNLVSTETKMNISRCIRE
jgi:hypothetical protein